MDPEFEKKLKGAGEVWKGIKGKAVSALDAMHAQGTPTGPARKKMLDRRGSGVTGTWDVSKPAKVGAGSAGGVLATKNARQSIVKPPIRESDIPTPSFKAIDTIPRDLGTPERSTIFTKARENIQRQKIKDNIVSMETTRGLNSGSDPFGPAPINRNVLQGFGYGSDPETIRFNRYLHARSMADTPEERAAISGNFFGTKGLDEERLQNQGIALGERIRARSAENVARISGKYGVEEARARGGGEPLKMYGGTLSQEDPDTGIKTQVPYNEYTGQIAPGYDSSANIELPAEVKAHIDKLKNSPDFDSWYRSQDENTRMRIRKYLGK